MSWTRENLNRSYVCNRELLKFFRERKSWSQQELSDQSSTSVRVICKAEAGESIATASIARLAEALSIADHVVYPEDLISYPVDLCRKFVDALREHRYRMTDVIDGMIDKDATFRITGDPKRIPFAGEHKQIGAYRRALKKFFQIFEYAPSFDHSTAYEYYPRGTDVVLWGVAQVRLIEGDGEIEALPHRRRFRFRRGLLYSFEDHYDVGRGEQFVADAVAIQGQRVYDPVEDSRSEES